MHLIKHLLSRGAEAAAHVAFKISNWAMPVGLLVLIVFIPPLLYISYTIPNIFSLLLVVQDEDDSTYEPIALDDITTTPNKPIASPSLTAAASLRSMHRLLYRNGGWRSFYRGYTLLTLYEAIMFTSVTITSVTLGTIFIPIATLVTSLALIQFSTLWVHIVVAPSTKSTLSRLPAFKPTFHAIWKATLLSWVNNEVLRWIFVLGFKYIVSDMKRSFADLPHATPSWMPLVVDIGLLGLSLFITLPSDVILARIQASLLPEKDMAIVHVNRSVDGSSKLATFNSQGYITIYHAWTSFSFTAWRRLLFLRAKAFLISVAFMVIFAVVFIAALFPFIEPVIVPK